ncbi:MAG: hypothetical protein K8R21_03125 [Leptospira sp.]|nr:hypothetical protein [Leptospira sp.]
MTPLIKTLFDLAEQVKLENTKGKEKIPTSDVFLRKMTIHFSRTEEEIKKFIVSLREAHYIFVINIVMPDPNLFVNSLDAYVYAEPGILTELKRFADGRIEQIYEGTFYKRKSAFQIVRELFPKIREYNNTPIGKAINEVVMLEEYNRLLASNPYEYSEVWKKERLYSIYQESDDEMIPVNPTDEGPVRAVDQVRDANANSSTNSKWGKTTSQFSVEFLVRIHFRKYEFETIRKLILTGRITKEHDLIYIRDTLKKMEGRTNIDHILKHYMNQMVELRRLAQAKLNIIRKPGVT